MVASERRADELDGMDQHAEQARLSAALECSRDEAFVSKSRLERIANAVKRAAVYDDEGDVDGLRLELGVIASVVGVDWIA